MCTRQPHRGVIVPDRFVDTRDLKEAKMLLEELAA
jgi:hypothetical protein